MLHAYDLQARAWRAMKEAGFAPELSPEALQQLQTLETSAQSLQTGLRDLRHLLWSSIDNDESRDLDQIETAEALPDGAIRIWVGIADVDSHVPQSSPLDRHAADNMTSVYTGVKTFPMLPTPLSQDLTSLSQDAVRIALVIEMEVAPDGSVDHVVPFRALVCNSARLTYNEAGPWLDDQDTHRAIENPTDRIGESKGIATPGSTPPLQPEIQQSPGLAEQLRLQHEAAKRLRAVRQERGALDFETVEARPVVAQGRVVDLEVTRKNQARYLIEDLMIAANTALARLLAEAGILSLQRVVRSPQRWPRIVEVAARWGESLPPAPDCRALADFLARRRAADPVHFPDLSLTIVKLLGPGEYTVVRGNVLPEGHFGLAVTTYTHSTAPNRRFADLVIQRLLKAYLAGSPPPYTEADLTDIARRCTEREDAARKVERQMRKVAAAALLSDRIGQTFDAIVTGASPKGTYVRLLAPPVEGRVVRHETALDVGDRTRVRLLSTDPDHGFIDFERVEGMHEN